MDDESLCSSGGGSAGGTAGVRSSLSQENAPPDQLALIRIYVPELNVEKCLQFHKEELIWEVKQQALSALPKVRPQIQSIKMKLIIQYYPNYLYRIL